MRGTKVNYFLQPRKNVQSYPAQKTKQGDRIICTERCENKILLRNNTPQEKSKAAEVAP